MALFHPHHAVNKNRADLFVNSHLSIMPGFLTYSNRLEQYGPKAPRCVDHSDGVSPPAIPLVPLPFFRKLFFFFEAVDLEYLKTESEITKEHVLVGLGSFPSPRVSAMATR